MAGTGQGGAQRKVDAPRHWSDREASVPAVRLRAETRQGNPTPKDAAPGKGSGQHRQALRDDGAIGGAEMP